MEVVYIKINTINDLSNVPLDKMLKVPHFNDVEKGEVLKRYTYVYDNIGIKDNAVYLILPHENSQYVRTTRICKHDKISCVNEDELYKIDKKLNEFGFKTRMGRNCDTGILSIVVLEEPEEESYKMSDICKDRETLRPEYKQFIQTEKGKEWKHFWQSQIGSEMGGDFGDYLYDFYPEMLQ